MNRSASKRTILTLVLALSIAAGMRLRASRIPVFDSRQFTAEYETAFHGKDVGFYDRFFSHDFWRGYQFEDRTLALTYLNQLFEQHDDLSAELRIHAITPLADRRGFLMNAHLTLRGRRLSDGQMETIDEVTGSSLYVYEDHSWRLYKMVEKKLTLLAEE